MARQVLAGVSVHETVMTALRVARAAAPSRPLDTRDVLVALMRVDTVGAWDRLWLYSGDIEAIAGKLVLDPANRSAAYWGDVPLTDSCATALDIAARLAHRYDLWPLPPGLLALGLVADGHTAAAMALDGLDRPALLELLQTEILGVPLAGIDAELRDAVAEGHRPRPIGPPAPGPAVRQGYCAQCGGTPAAAVTVYGHRGLVVWMRFSHTDGPLCRYCGLATYRQMTVQNLWLGWWSPLSVFINPVIMLLNVLSYPRVARLAPPVPGMPGRPLDPGKPLLRRWAAVGFVFPLVLACTAVAMVTFAQDRIPGVNAPTASDTALVDNDDVAGACTPRRTKYSVADPYAGAGPHPLVVFRTDELGSVGPVDTSVLDADRPREWMAVDPERYQLVVCLGAAEDGDLLSQCEFGSGTVPVYQGIYRATVYRTRTGAKVATAQLGGAATYRCPYFTLLPRRDAKLHTEPDLAGLRAGLSAYVDATVSGTAPRPGALTDLRGLCRALAPRIPRVDQLPSLGNGTDKLAHQSCEWFSSDRSVRVEVVDNASAHAAGVSHHMTTEVMADPKSGGSTAKVPDIGDDAVIAPMDLTGGRAAKVAVLIGSVTVTVVCTGRNQPYTDTAQQATAVAREATALATK